ncbi:MAG: urease accessory protein UreF [Cellvibrionaceae bacterium]
MVTEDSQTLLHLMQLVSPALPVGAYAYSQGLESAVEQQWVSDADSAENWIGNVMIYNLGNLDGPILARLHGAWLRRDLDALNHWNHFIQASRESRELLLEDLEMGAALRRLLLELDVPGADRWGAEDTSFAGMFSLAASHWQLSEDHMLNGFVWSWLENQVAAAIKLVPLGQTQGQKLLINLMPVVRTTVQRSKTVADDELGASLPRLALASMQHEVQYSRLFRS